MLRNVRLAREVCGKVGGYRLRREPSEITVREILEAVIGLIAIVKGVVQPAGGMLAEFCESRPVYGLINERISDACQSYFGAHAGVEGPDAVLGKPTYPATPRAVLRVLEDRRRDATPRRRSPQRSVVTPRPAARRRQRSVVLATVLLLALPA